MKYKPTICYRQFKDTTPASDKEEVITAYYVGDNAFKAFGMSMNEQPDNEDALEMIKEELGLIPGTYDLVPLPPREDKL